MVYIYLPAAYYHRNLDVTKENLAAGFSAVPAVFLVVNSLMFMGNNVCIFEIKLFHVD